MKLNKLNFLSSPDIRTIHNASLRILDETGMVIHHGVVLEKLAAAGVRVELHKKLVRFNEEQVMWAVAQAGKQFERPKPFNRLVRQF